MRVGLDLDGSLESLGNSMTDLADALVRTGEVELVRFRSRTSASSTSDETHLSLRGLWSPLWRRSRGRSIDGLLRAVDVIHVAGLATPPPGAIPLVISVDDLRPLRGEARTHLRMTQLKRAVERGAILVASSRSASHEVIAVLGVQRNRVVVVPPAVPVVAATSNGEDLVVNITGADDVFLAIAPALLQYCDDPRIEGRRPGEQRSGPANTREWSRAWRYDQGGRRAPRSRTPASSCTCRTVHASPRSRSLPCRRAYRPLRARPRSTANSSKEPRPSPPTIKNSSRLLDEAWMNESRRAIMIAAGKSRAVDFAPDTAARAYLSLYHEVVRGWTS